MGKYPVSHLDTTEDESMHSDVPSTSAKPTRGKKRKSPETAAKEQRVAGRAHTKKARGNRGILKELVEMPLDVLFEIFGCLEPIDLLHLAWTSKALRALLMTRSSASVWRQTFHNLPSPQPPKCPGDLNEPQYAELLFRKACHFCNKSLGMIHVAWAARLRSCTKCLDLNLQETTFELKSYGPQLQRLLPQIILKKKYGQHRRGTSFSCPETDRAWTEQFESIDSTAAKRRWVEETIKHQTVIAEHAKACEEWSNLVQIRLEGQKGKAIDERKEQIRQYIRRLGFGQELDLLKPWSDQPEKIPIVDKACRKELTDAVLDSLQEPLVEFMESARAKRLENLYLGIAGKRLNDLKAIRNTWIESLPANSIYPTCSELTRLPFIQNIFDNLTKEEKLTEAHLESIRLALDDLNIEWQENIRNELIEIVSRGSEDTVDPDTALDLATTFFACTTCFRPRFLRYPNVIMHKCTTTLDWHLSNEGDKQTRFLRNHFKETFWNTKKDIVVKPEHTAFVAELVRLAGLNPKTATVQEMDALDPIFECVSCNHFLQGRATMTWKTALVHGFMSPHRGTEGTTKTTFKPILLENLEATIIRPRMKEENERRLRVPNEDYYPRERSMVCVRCKRTGGFLDLWEHMKEGHDIPNATEEDIVPAIDSVTIPPLYRHWPPRPTAEVDDN